MSARWLASGLVFLFLGLMVVMKTRLTFLVIVAISVALAVRAEGQEVSDSTYLENERLIVAPVQGENSYHAYSKTKGEWSTQRFPAGVEVVPVVGSKVCVFKLSSGTEKITHLFAVDQTGKFVSIKRQTSQRRSVE